jgi:PAS domain S-box-containing protein
MRPAATDALADLRGCLRDMVALSALPAVWTGAAPAAIAASLADALTGILRAELVYVRLDAATEEPIEAAHAQGRPAGPVQAHELGLALAPWLGAPGRAESSAVPDPAGPGGVRLDVVPIRYDGGGGLLAAGARRRDFPIEHERLLLRAAANQAAIALHGAHLAAARAQAEHALRLREQELSDFVEQAPIGLHWVGPDGRILWANQAELELLGMTREDYIGHNIAEFHADPAAIAAILACLRRGEILHAYEARLRAKDGSIKHVLISSNVLWEGARFVHTRCFTRDITERKRVEEALRARLRQQAAVADLGRRALRGAAVAALMDEAAALIAETLAVEYCKVLELLPDGTVLRLCAGAGWRDGLVGRATLDAGRGSHGGYTLASGAPVIVDDLRTERRFIAPPLLQEHGVISGLSCIIHGPGRPFGVLGAYTRQRRTFTEDDVHFLQAVANLLAMAIERRHAEQDREALLARERAARAAAEAALQTRDEFLSIASHELRNPVAGIKGTAQFLRRARQRGQLDGERLDRYLATIEQTSAHLALLTEDLLDVSRLQRGALPLRLRPTDLAELARDVAARQQARTGSHRLLVDAAAVPGMLAVDPERVELIVTNLVENAIKYSPGGGDILITLRQDRGGVALRVTDPGIGLPAGAAERIFEPFGRAPNAAERNIPGLGLGLYIGRRIAEQHGGRLWAESAGEGQGTTMALWLPGAAAEPEAGARDA